MAVSSTNAFVIQAGNGTTTAIPVTFYFLANSHLVVVSKVTATGVETTKTLTTDYTVTGAGNPAGGTVTMVVAPASGTTVTVERAVPQTQASRYLNDGTFDVTNIEEDLDRVTMIMQDLQRQINLCPKYRSTESAPTVDFGAAVDRAGKYFHFDDDGNYEAVELTDEDASALAAAASASAAAVSQAAAAASEAAAVAAAASVALPASPVAGDMLYHDGASWVSLAKGTAAQLLKMNAGATAPEWASFNALPSSSLAAGDIVYWNGSAWTRLAIGTSGQFLSLSGSAPAWATLTGFSTGDVKMTLKTTADSGWVLMNDGTIGNAASGASTRANADTVDLFTLLWNNTADAQCAVSTGRGANAAADYAANKTIALPKALGRALATYGAGSGLTSRALALATGTETHTIVEAEMAAHTHVIKLTTDATNSGDGVNRALGSIDANTTADTASTSSSIGSGTAHNNMQPTLFLNVMIKL
jgi:hypothetical protein